MAEKDHLWYLGTNLRFMWHLWLFQITALPAKCGKFVQNCSVLFPEPKVRPFFCHTKSPIPSSIHNGIIREKCQILTFVCETWWNPPPHTLSTLMSRYFHNQSFWCEATFLVLWTWLNFCFVYHLSRSGALFNKRITSKPQNIHCPHTVQKLWWRRMIKLIFWLYSLLWKWPLIVSEITSTAP